MTTTFHRNREFRELAEKLDVEITYSQKAGRYFLRHSPFGILHAFVKGSTEIDRARLILNRIEECRANFGSISERVRRVVLELQLGYPAENSLWNLDSPSTAGDEWDSREFNGRFSYSIRLLNEQPLDVVARKGERIYQALEEAVIARWGSDAWPALNLHAPVGGAK